MRLCRGALLFPEFASSRTAQLPRRQFDSAHWANTLTHSLVRSRWFAKSIVRFCVHSWNTTSPMNCKPTNLYFFFSARVFHSQLSIYDRRKYNKIVVTRESVCVWMRSSRTTEKAPRDLAVCKMKFTETNAATERTRCMCIVCSNSNNKFSIIFILSLQVKWE